MLDAFGANSNISNVCSFSILKAHDAHNRTIVLLCDLNREYAEDFIRLSVKISCYGCVHVLVSFLYRLVSFQNISAVQIKIHGLYFSGVIKIWLGQAFHTDASALLK